MKFNFFSEDFLIDNINESEAVNFIKELGLSPEEENKAVINYLKKSFANLAKDESLIVTNNEVIRYLDEKEDSSVIVVRKPYEQRIVSLEFNFKNNSATIFINKDGTIKEKSYTENLKTSDLLKTFNACITSIQK